MFYLLSIFICSLWFSCIEGKTNGTIVPGAIPKNVTTKEGITNEQNYAALKLKEGHELKNLTGVVNIQKNNTTNETKIETPQKNLLNTSIHPSRKENSTEKLGKNTSLQISNQNKSKLAKNNLVPDKIGRRM